MLTWHVSGELYKQAGVAQAHMERVEDLSLIEPLRGDVTLAERRHAQVHERSGKTRSAQAAHS